MNVRTLALLVIAPLLLLGRAPQVLADAKSEAKAEEAEAAKAAKAKAKEAKIRADGFFVTTDHFLVFCANDEFESGDISEADARRVADVLEARYTRFTEGLGLEPPKGVVDYDGKTRTHVLIYDWWTAKDGTDANAHDNVYGFTKLDTGTIHFQTKHWGADRGLHDTDDATMEFIAAHEMFHAIQATYLPDVGESPVLYEDYRWMIDATADWAAAEAYPGALPQQYLFGHQNWFLAEPQLPLARSASMWGTRADEYGTSIFFRFLSKHYGGPDLLPQLMTEWRKEIARRKESGGIDVWSASFHPHSVIQATLHISDAEMRELCDRFHLACVLGADAEYPPEDAARLTLVAPADVSVDGSAVELSGAKWLGMWGFQCYRIVRPSRSTSGGTDARGPHALYLEVPASSDDLSVHVLWRPGKGRLLRTTKAPYDADRRRYFLRVPEYDKLVEIGKASSAGDGHVLVIVSLVGKASSAYPVTAALGDPPVVTSLKLTQEGRTTFSAVWTDEPHDAGTGPSRRIRTVDGGDGPLTSTGADVELVFSMPVSAPPGASLPLSFDDKPVSTLTSGDDGLTWTGSLSANWFAGDKHKFKIQAEAKLDAAYTATHKLALDVDPATVARPAGKTWEGYEQTPPEMVIELGGPVKPEGVEIQTTRRVPDKETNYDRTGVVVKSSALRRIAGAPDARIAFHVYGAAAASGPFLPVSSPFIVSGGVPVRNEGDAAPADERLVRFADDRAMLLADGSSSQPLYYRVGLQPIVEETDAFQLDRAEAVSGVSRPGRGASIKILERPTAGGSYAGGGAAGGVAMDRLTVGLSLDDQAVDIPGAEVAVTVAGATFHYFMSSHSDSRWSVVASFPTQPGEYQATITAKAGEYSASRTVTIAPPADVREQNERTVAEQTRMLDETLAQGAQERDRRLADAMQALGRAQQSLAELNGRTTSTQDAVSLASATIGVSGAEARIKSVKLQHERLTRSTQARRLRLRADWKGLLTALLALQTLDAEEVKIEQEYDNVYFAEARRSAVAQGPAVAESQLPMFDRESEAKRKSQAIRMLGPQYDPEIADAAVAAGDYATFKAAMLRMIEAARSTGDPSGIESRFNRLADETARLTGNREQAKAYWEQGRQAVAKPDDDVQNQSRPAWWPEPAGAGPVPRPNVAWTLDDGPDGVAVPGVTGLTVREAVEKLRAVGLGATRALGSDAPSPEQAFRVEAVEPPAGTKLQAGSQIDLILYVSPASAAGR